MSGVPADLVVGYAGTHRQARAGAGPLTFGRDPTCSLVFDPPDPGVSRIAGSLEVRDDLWWVCNRSSKRTLHLVDGSGLRAPVPPRRRHLVALPRCTVIVNGSVWSYSVTISGPPAAATGPVSELPASDPVPTQSEAHACTENERLALVAMFAGYLRPHPRYDPTPATYQEAGDRLGVPATTVRRRIEHLRQRLTEQGVAGLEGRDGRRRLAEYALLHGLISSEDLRLLER